MDHSQVIFATLAHAHLVHDNGVNSSSPSTSFDPLTPLNPVDIADLLDERVLMTPPIRPGLPHASTYTYGSDAYAGLSSERTTAAIGADNGIQPQWPPKADPDATPHPVNHALPSMRHTEAVAGQYWNTPIQQPYAQPYSFNYTHPHAQYPQHAYHYPPQKHYYPSYQPTYAYSAMPQAYHPAYHITSTPSADLYTPASAPAQYNGGTIQPSAFSGWHNDPRRETVEPNGVEEDRLTERRPSVTSVSEKWEAEASPASVVISDNGSEYVETVTPARKKGKKAKATPVKLEVVDGEVTYTTDCEVKQTPTLKRRCLNCNARSPPSWRKSVLQPGHILCNKCGIFERTHHRPRPPQNDETKLRKGGPSSYRRHPPSPLVARGHPFPPDSPFSAVTSQATPSSAATPGYTFPQVPHSAHTTYSMPPPQVEPSHTQSFHPASTYSGRRYSHATMQAYGWASPYGQAYSRRTASYNTTPTLSVMRASGSMAAAAEHWEQSRRHSDGVEELLEPGSTTDPSSPK